MGMCKEADQLRRTRDVPKTAISSPRRCIEEEIRGLRRLRSKRVGAGEGLQVLLAERWHHRQTNSKSLHGMAAALCARRWSLELRSRPFALDAIWHGFPALSRGRYHFKHTGSGAGENRARNRQHMAASKQAWGSTSQVRQRNTLGNCTRACRYCMRKPLSYLQNAVAGSTCTPAVNTSSVGPHGKRALSAPTITASQSGQTAVQSRSGRRRQ